MNLQHAQILIVDDVPENLKLLYSILSAEGYKVRPVSDGQFALQSVAAEEPDLILLDVKMPGMDGYEVCRQLKSNGQHRGIPVIFISASIDVIDKVKGFEAGALDFISKPFEPSEVLARVKTHLRLRQLQRHMGDLIQQRTKQLSKEKALLQSVVRSSPTGIAVIVDQKITDVNWRICSILGYDEQELVGCTARMLFQSEEEFKKILRKVIADLEMKDVSSNETCFRRKDGQIIDVLLNCSYIDHSSADNNIEEPFIQDESFCQDQTVGKLNTGTTIGHKHRSQQMLNFTILDITERKRVEHAMRNSELRYRTIFDNTGTGMMIYDKDMVITLANAELVALAGIPKDKLEGTKWTAYIQKDLLGKVMEYHQIQQLDPTKGPMNYETRIGNAAGQILDILVTVAGIPNTSSSVASIIDITEKKILGAKLLQSQKLEAIGILAGGIAHDFNNILCAILGYTDMGLVNSKDSSLYRYFEQIFQAGTRAKDLVNQILTFSRQTNQELKPVPVSLIAKEVLRLLRSTLPTTIEIQQDISSSFQSDVMLGDPTQIHQVFMNLCTNAAHAMVAQGGVLRVRVAEIEVNMALSREIPGLVPGYYVMFEVSDTGCGMNKQTVEKIFQPYFTTKSKGQGTGLGLAVVSGIIKKFKGTITVTSEVGKGTTFQVYFPQFKEQISQSVEVKKIIPTGIGRILFVDDEKVIGDMCKEMLETLGYQVTVATSSVEALEIFRDTPDVFDLIFTDMTMAKMTGIELSIKCRKIRADVPIILGSGYTELINTKSIHDARINKLIKKPYTMEEMAENIQSCLRKQIS